jgi:hypothetical protein
MNKLALHVVSTLVLAVSLSVILLSACSTTPANSGNSGGSGGGNNASFTVNSVTHNFTVNAATEQPSGGESQYYAADAANRP